MKLAAIKLDRVKSDNDLRVLILILVFFLASLAASVVFASDPAGSLSSPAQGVTPSAPPKIKATYTSYYYDFDGTKGSANNLYNFGHASLSMQLLSLEYQATPTWTLMAIGTYLVDEVETYYRPLPTLAFKSDDITRGFGDTVVSAVHPFYFNGPFMAIVDFGASLPTGSIDEKNKALLTRNYAYNFQNGSGTYDGIIGLTSLWLKPSYQLGSRLSADIRTGQTNDGYRLGNLYKLDAWLDYPLAAGFIPRLVGYYKHKDAILGADSTEPRDANTEVYYHPEIDWQVAASLKYQHSFGNSFSLGGEFGVPLAQDCQNSDDVIVSTNYFADIFVSGRF